MVTLHEERLGTDNREMVPLFGKLDDLYKGRIENLISQGIDCIVPLVKRINAGGLLDRLDSKERALTDLVSNDMLEEYELVKLYAEELISKFTRRDWRDVKAQDLSLQISHANTNPLKVVVDGREYFIKQFDPTRFLGLQLYSLLGDIGENYRFGFTEHDIVETGVPGRHAFEIEQDELDRIKKDSRYIRDRVFADLYLEKLRLDDVFKTEDFAGKEDNYVITPENRIVIVDHNNFRYNSVRDLEKRREDTAKELGISNQEYQKIYKDCLLYLNSNIMKNRRELGELFDILSTDSSLRMEAGMLRRDLL